MHRPTLLPQLRLPPPLICKTKTITFVWGGTKITALSVGLTGIIPPGPVLSDWAYHPMQALSRRALAPNVLRTTSLWVVACSSSIQFGWMALATWLKLPIHVIYPKIHILNIVIFTKFTVSKSKCSQNSHFQNLIFDKIHIFRTSFIFDKSTGFLDKKQCAAPSRWF